MTPQHAVGNGNFLKPPGTIYESARTRYTPTSLSFYTNRCDGNFTTMETISIQSMLDQMQATDAKGKRLPFTLKGIKLDLERNTGGERYRYKSAVLKKHTATHVWISSAGSTQLRKHPIILIEYFNEKQVTV